MSRLMIVLLCFSLCAACSDDTKVSTPDRKVASDVTQTLDKAPDKTSADKAVPDKMQPDRSLIDYKPYFDGTPPDCPVHTAIAPNVPCICYGVLVYNVAVQFPECKAPMEMHCCPGTLSPNCETPGED
jgi:hypothetical protein